MNCIESGCDRTRNGRFARCNPYRNGRQRCGMSKCNMLMGQIDGGVTLEQLKNYICV